jgi:hypothetical protein
LGALYVQFIKNDEFGISGYGKSYRLFPERHSVSKEMCYMVCRLLGIPTMQTFKSCMVGVNDYREGGNKAVP